MKKFFNADRSLSATVDYAQCVDTEYFFDSSMRESCEVFLNSEHLSSFFHVQPVQDIARVNKAIGKAQRDGSRIFFIEIFEYGSYAVRINPTYQPMCEFDSGLNGVIVVKESPWKTLISPIYTRGYVQRQMDYLAECIEAWLNGDFFEFEVVDHDDRTWYGPFLSEQEAQEELQSEYPQICYSEENFECVCTYRLRPECRLAVS